jgi:LPXTG-site transpeptidase (sortase) family protein
VNDSTRRASGGSTASGIALPLLLLAAGLVVVGLLLPSGHAAGNGRHDRSRPVAALAAIGAPERLVVPSVGIDAPVVPIETSTDGVLTPPADVDTAGWWRRSAEPGARAGQVLVTGHTVHDGDGSMDAIGGVKAGDRVRLRSGEQTAIYRATAVAVYSRAEVAGQARRLFGQDRDRGRLVLVTCTDWNGEDYESNIIVFADPVRRP